MVLLKLKGEMKLEKIVLMKVMGGKTMIYLEVKLVM